MVFKDTLNYLDTNSWLHKTTPEVKFIWILIVIAYCIMQTTIASQLFVLSLLMIILMSTKPPKNYLKTYLIMLCSLILSTTLFQGAFYYRYYQGEKVTIILQIIPRDTPILSFLTANKGIAFTYEGILYGLFVSLKICNAILASLIFIATTKSSEIINLLRKMRLPYKLIIVVIMAIRFIPTIMEEINRILIAFKQKGYNFSLLNIMHSMRLIAKNLVFSNIRRAISLSISLELRRFKGNVIISQGKYNLRSNAFLFSTVALLVIISIII